MKTPERYGEGILPDPEEIGRSIRDQIAAEQCGEWLREVARRDIGWVLDELKVGSTLTIEGIGEPATAIIKAVEQAGPLKTILRLRNLAKGPGES